MKKILFLSLVLTAFIISCAGENEPGLQSTRPEEPEFKVPADKEIKNALDKYYTHSVDGVDTIKLWEGANSTLVTDDGVLHDKVLLGALGNTGVGPGGQNTFVALFIGADGNVGYASANTAKAAVDQAKGSAGGFLTSWDPRKAVYTDSGRVKIAWLSRAARDPGGNVGFLSAKHFNDGKLGINRKLGDGKLASTARYDVIEHSGTNANARPGEELPMTPKPIKSFVYEKALNAGGESPARRGWSWSGDAEAYHLYGGRYDFSVVAAKDTHFGYAPSGGEEQSDVAFVWGTTTGKYNIELSIGTQRNNNRNPLGKQIIFRQDGTGDTDVGVSSKRLVMLTSVVADSVRLHSEKTDDGNKVILLEFPATSGAEAFYDGYGSDAVEFPGYQNVFAGITDIVDITPDGFGNDKVDGKTLLAGKTYQTMKVPFLLLDAE